MQQLTGLDAAFLAMEDASVYGHVGSVCVLDVTSAPAPLTLDRLTGLVGERLHLIPPFRRRLVGVPLGLDQPYWIEDPDFDIEYHVRSLGLPAPGDARQLAEQAARLHARPLDRSRPLWELYLIEGLEGGRVAIYTKVHHAAIDGVSGNDILSALLDLTPEGRDVGPAPEWEPDPRPSQVSMLARSAVSLAGQPLRAARLTYGLARSVPSIATSPARPRLPVIDRLLGRDAKVVLNTPGLRAPATPFNKRVTPHRRWGFVSLSLADVKTVKRAGGLTVNDVVMALATGALRRWLTDHDALPDAPLVAAVPVSVRSQDQRGTYGNRVSTMIAALPTHVDDPGKRLRLVHEAMLAAKEQHGALPADLLADVTQFAMPALAGQANRLNARLRLLERVNPFNLFISNVPGPDRPLYYAGGRLLAYYPLSAISHGQGLNITVHSFDGQLHFGLLADRELVPDVSRMASYLGDELDVLHRLLTGEPASPPTASSEGGGFPDPRPDAAAQGQRLRPA